MAHGSFGNFQSDEHLSSIAKKLKEESDSLVKLDTMLEEKMRVFSNFAIALRLKADFDQHATISNAMLPCWISLQMVTFSKFAVNVQIENNFECELSGWKLLIELRPMVIFAGHIQENNFQTVNEVLDLPLIESKSSTCVDVVLWDIFKSPIMQVRCFLMRIFEHPISNESLFYKVQIGEKIITLIDCMIGSSDAIKNKYTIENFSCYRHLHATGHAAGEANIANVVLKFGQNFFTTLFKCDNFNSTAASILPLLLPCLSSPTDNTRRRDSSSSSFTLDIFNLVRFTVNSSSDASSGWDFQICLEGCNCNVLMPLLLATLLINLIMKFQSKRQIISMQRFVDPSILETVRADVKKALELCNKKNLDSQSDADESSLYSIPFCFQFCLCRCQATALTCTSNLLLLLFNISKNSLEAMSKVKNFEDVICTKISVKPSHTRKLDLSNSSTQVPCRQAVNSYSQTENESKAVQTDGQNSTVRLTNANLTSDDKLLMSFLNRAERTLMTAVRRSENYGKIISDGRGTTSQIRNAKLIQNLTFDNLKNMPISAIAYNCNGSLVAATYAYSNHESWCFHESMVCLWTTASGGSGEMPNCCLLSTSCYNDLCFHPSNPSLLALAQRNGKVEVADVSGKATLDSERNHILITGVNCIGWKNADTVLCGSSEGVVTLVRCGRDRKLQLWSSFSISLASLPKALRAGQYPWKMKTSISRVASLAHDSDEVVVATETGALLLCDAKCDWHSDETYANSIQPAVVKDDAVRLCLDHHCGPVSDLASPDFACGGLFSSAGTDGMLKFYLNSKLIKLYQFDIAKFVLSIAWFHVWPLHFVCLLRDGHVELHNLLTESNMPAFAFRAFDGQLNSGRVVCNPILPNILLISSDQNQPKLYRLEATVQPVPNWRAALTQLCSHRSIVVLDHLHENQYLSFLYLHGILGMFCWYSDAILFDSKWNFPIDEHLIMSDREFFLAFMLKNFMEIGIRLELQFVAEKLKSLPRNIREKVDAFIGDGDLKTSIKACSYIFKLDGGSVELINENIMNVLVALNNMIWNHPNHMVPLSEFLQSMQNSDMSEKLKTLFSITDELSFLDFMKKYQAMFQLFSEPAIGMWIIAVDRLPFFYEIQALIEKALPDF
ncbi:WD repeat-containing protein 34 [Trichinella pseudospiralis]|uniref:WD repeat-containing protein 34 n=1 Tax=Trichinella pseudospiralis TaxID=6337 RepID=A0A0V1FAY5_TRIPS|nr:WD repeat-containing protein 34 [Trichinella pseudospiralis]